MNTGELGEKIARGYLEKKGYEILETNFVFRIFSSLQNAEIDIIAKKAGVFIFVEVKTVSLGKGNHVFFPENKINLVKKKKIARAAQAWLMKNNIPLDSKCQLDAIAIEINEEVGKARVRHVENIML